MQAVRAPTRTRPTVVAPHRTPGSGRSTPAVRATHDLRETAFRAVVDDLRGDSHDKPPLPSRDALPAVRPAGDWLGDDHEPWQEERSGQARNPGRVPLRLRGSGGARQGGSHDRGSR